MDTDTQVREAAFRKVERLMRVHGGYIPGSELQRFNVGGSSYRYMHTQMGIYKPPALPHVLSVKTTIKHHTWVKYEDQARELHQFFGMGEHVEYDLMRRKDVPVEKTADISQNVYLHKAMVERVPILYLINFATSKYFAIPHTYVIGFDRDRLSCRLGFSNVTQHGDALSLYSLAHGPGKYVGGMQPVRQAFHSLLLKDALAKVYQERCAISNIKGFQLVNVARIVPDVDAKLGELQPTNGILLSKLHHAAFEADLLGIDQDFRVHVSDRLKHMLDAADADLFAKDCRTRIALPRNAGHWPDQDRLRQRFEEYRQANYT